MNNFDLLPILAIDTTTDVCSVSIYYDDNKYITQNIKIKNIHSEKIFNAIQQCLDNFGIASKDIKAIALSNGPGSFTGLRIGMSAAKGIATGLNIPIYAIQTFDLIAFQLSHFIPSNNVVNIINQADTEEVYYAKYLIKSTGSFDTITPITVLRKDSITIDNNELYFGKVNNFSQISNSIYSPDADYIAKYLLQNLDKIVPADIANVEPFYLKNFKLRQK